MRDVPERIQYNGWFKLQTEDKKWEKRSSVPNPMTLFIWYGVSRCIHSSFDSRYKKLKMNQSFESWRDTSLPSSFIGKVNCMDGMTFDCDSADGKWKDTFLLLKMADDSSNFYFFFLRSYCKIRIHYLYIYNILLIKKKIILKFETNFNFKNIK